MTTLSFKTNNQNTDNNNNIFSYKTRLATYRQKEKIKYEPFKNSSNYNINNNKNINSKNFISKSLYRYARHEPKKQKIFDKIYKTDKNTEDMLKSLKKTKELPLKEYNQKMVYNY